MMMEREPSLILKDIRYYMRYAMSESKELATAVTYVEILHRTAETCKYLAKAHFLLYKYKDLFNLKLGEKMLDEVIQEIFDQILHSTVKELVGKSIELKTMIQNIVSVIENACNEEANVKT